MFKEKYRETKNIPNICRGDNIISSKLFRDARHYINGKGAIA
jgi:hypothetical protein